MNAPTSAADKSLPVHPDVEAEIRKLAQETTPKRPAQLENEVERIRSSITRLTSSSIDGLQELTSELQELQRFLNSEVQRVQGEIESALAGIKIIVGSSARMNEPTRRSSPLIVRSAALRNNVFRGWNTSSIGLNSGEYCGR